MNFFAIQICHYNAFTNLLVLIAALIIGCAIIARIAFLTRSQSSRKDKNEEYLFHKYELIDQN